jgi:protein-S-isoprenylcysteine O-methyltransferase Ste14
VSEGVCSFTSNPQYLGYLARLPGGAVGRRSAPGLLLTGTAAAVLDRWIPIEERHLRRTHGSKHDQYAGRIARWLNAHGLRSVSRGGQRVSDWVGSWT